MVHACGIKWRCGESFCKQLCHILCSGKCSMYMLNMTESVFKLHLVMMQAGNQEDIAKYSKRTVRVTQQHNDECKRLLTLMGVPIINVSLAML